MTKKKPTKLLIDTSAVGAVLGHTTANHSLAIADQLGSAKLFGSTYVRMETVRRWICHYIRIAVLIECHDSVEEALVRLEQDFGAREPKATISGLRLVLAQNPTAMTSPKSAAKEFARIAVHLLHQYDKKFSSRINNRSQCEIGSMKLEPDFGSLISECREFYLAFFDNVLNCKINGFLRLSRSNSDASRLIANNQAVEAKAVANLKKLQEKASPVTCKNCKKIGDGVIALETPKSMGVAAIDKEFSAICEALGLHFEHLPSVVAADKPADDSAR